MMLLQCLLAQTQCATQQALACRCDYETCYLLTLHQPPSNAISKPCPATQPTMGPWMLMDLMEALCALRLIDDVPALLSLLYLL